MGYVIYKIFLFLVEKGSKLLIEEFPSSEDFKETKEEIEKI